MNGYYLILISITDFILVTIIKKNKKKKNLLFERFLTVKNGNKKQIIL